jgi:hypothetical protein
MLDRKSKPHENIAYPVKGKTWTNVKISPNVISVYYFYFIDLFYR